MFWTTAAVWGVLIAMAASACNEDYPCGATCWYCTEDDDRSDVGCSTCEQETERPALYWNVRARCVELHAQEPCEVDRMAVEGCFWEGIDSKATPSTAASDYCEAIEQILDRCDLTARWRHCILTPVPCGSISCEVEASAYTDSRLKAMTACAETGCNDMAACLHEAIRRTTQAQYPDSFAPGYGITEPGLCRDGTAAGEGCVPR